MNTKPWDQMGVVEKCAIIQTQYKAAVKAIDQLVQEKPQHRQYEAYWKNDARQHRDECLRTLTPFFAPEG